MLLAFDIGNTNIVVGCFEKDQLLREFRFKSDAGRPLDEYAGMLCSLLDRSFKESWSVTGCVISSVVPLLTPVFQKLSKEHFSVEALVINWQNAGIEINVKEPGSVGADRIVNSVAAAKVYGAPGLVVDFGTATTFDVISSTGAYEGGIIAPGFAGSLETLVRTTALLPRIELKWPDSAVGKTTISAMQSGVVRGYVCMVDGLIDMLESEVGQFKELIATGGLGRVITEHSRKLKTHCPDLTLRGMRIIAKKHGMI